MNDPLNLRLELLNQLVSSYALDESDLNLIKKEVGLLNTFALATHWDKVEVLIQPWIKKTKDTSVNNMNLLRN